jgi:hypothetical protein
MAEEIPLERRAHVIVSYDRNLIGGLENVPPDTEKVYYRGLTLKAPKWRDTTEVALRLAEAGTPEVVEELELEKNHTFTGDLEEAMRFEHNKVDDEVRMLRSRLGAKIGSECLDEEYVPF